jgi:2-polyprenyl-6-methoxyphenol hydroxylase-like FAD-dependent oxidoreductase
LVAQGLPLTRFSFRDRDQLLTELSFASLPSKFSCLLMLPQDQTERIMRNAYDAAEGQVRWNHAVDNLSTTTKGVMATVSTPAGRHDIVARYVVGADGMQSIVRKTAGIGFTGSSYEESFVLADVDMEWGHGRDEVMLFFSPAGMVVVAPLPDGRFRIVATMDDAPAQPGVSDIQGLLDERGPTRGAASVSRVHWSSRFRLHHRLADQYRHGPYFVVGDAAHVHSPAGGQGMNMGLVDACVLGRLLADVISGQLPESELDQYQRLRRPAAKHVMGLVGRMTRLATTKSAPRRVLRNFVLRFINSVPMARRKLEHNLSGISRRHLASNVFPATDGLKS